MDATTESDKIKGLLCDGSVQGLNNIGAIYFQKREFDKSIKFYSKALALAKIQFGEKHPDIGIIYFHLGQASYYWPPTNYENQASRDLEKATEFTTKALAILLPTLGENHPVTASCYNNFAKIEDDKGNHDFAIQLFTKALAISRACGTPELHAATATTYHQLGRIYFVKKEYEQALEYQTKALVIRQAVLGENHPDTAECYSQLGGIRLCGRALRGP